MVGRQWYRPLDGPGRQYRGQFREKPNAQSAKSTEAPRIFCLSRATFYRTAKRGGITIHTRGSRSLLKVSEVSDWIERCAPNGAKSGGGLVGKIGAKE